jgi:hypothetical protein
MRYASHTHPGRGASGAEPLPCRHESRAAAFTLKTLRELPPFDLVVFDAAFLRRKAAGAQASTFSSQRFRSSISSSQTECSIGYSRQSMA